MSGVSFGGGISILDGNSAKVLFQTGIPFIMLSSGTLSSTGALSGITTLPISVPGGAFCYFPAGANLPQGAGWYWTILSTSSSGTVYNNLYTSGDPALVSPGYGVAGTAIASGATSYTQTTSEITSLQFTLAGGTMGPHGRIETWFTAQNVNSANNKVFNYKLGSSTLWTRTRTTTTYESPLIPTWNMGGEARQATGDPAAPVTASSSGNNYTAVDTSANTTVALAITLGSAAEYIIVYAARTVLFQ